MQKTISKGSLFLIFNKGKIKMTKAIRYSKRLVLGLLCLMFSLTFGYSQKTKKLQYTQMDTVSNYEVRLKDGSVFTGKYLETRGDTMHFNLASSRLAVRKNEMAGIRKVNRVELKEGTDWYPNPHHTRYLFGPSAFNLKTGEGYYQNIYGVVNSVNFGINDNFSIGGGTELISLFNGNPFFGIFPKIGNIKLGKNVTGGLGTLMVVGERGFGGIGYGLVTFGDEDRNFTLGAGGAFGSGEISPQPILTFSGMYRVSRNIALISENWAVVSDGIVPVFSYGIRFFGEKISVDVAFINNGDILQEISPIGIPFLDFVYKF